MPSLDHLAVLSDNVGVLQHATESVPNRAHGYCTDDVSRAFMVALAYERLHPGDARTLHLAGIYLAFLHHAQLDNGRFHNFMDYDRRWIDRVGGPDCCGRAIWALGYGVAAAPNDPWRRVCTAMLDRALPAFDPQRYLRPRAYAALGLSYAYGATGEPRYATALRTHAAALQAAYEKIADPQWQWFEETLYYDNARLPEALLRAAAALEEARFRNIGLESLAFYETITTENGVHVPIGNEGWYHRGGTRARYAQQPLEACAMVDAQLAAYVCTENPAHIAAAELALAWFYGKNSRKIVMAQGGGCFDGLEADRVNHNMGAESTLALLAAAYATAAANVAVFA